MAVDLAAAASFMAGHARQLDRRRFELLFAAGEPAAVLAALDGYRNADGGYGWGIEPDLRAPESQPAGALHAFEVLAEAAPLGEAQALSLCEWLAAATLPDGGLPFALPVSDATGVASFWAGADPTRSSLQITAYVAGTAHRVPAVASHPWLAGATRYCAEAIAATEEQPHAIALSAALGFLDAAGEERLLDHLGRFIPEDGCVHVGGGAEDEYMRPLDFAPYPGRPARRLFSPEVVEADLDRLAGLQQDDGGWTVDFGSFSLAAELEWRGYMTVRALSLLRANGRA